MAFLKTFFAALLMVSTLQLTWAADTKPPTGDGIPDAVQNPAAENAIRGDDHNEIWQVVRGLLARQQVREFLREELKEFLMVDETAQSKFGFPEKLKDLSEGQLFIILNKFPDLTKIASEYLKKVPEIDEGNKRQEELRKQFRERILALAKDDAFFEQFRKYNDPVRPIPLLAKEAGPGFKDLRVYANHPRLEDGKVVPAVDVEAQIVKFIGTAKKQLVMNVFEFDSKRIADALIAQHKAGVDVRVGIDKNTAEKDEDIKAIYEHLKKSGVNVEKIDSVSLNHQKLMALDWTIAGEGQVMYSSGNFTQSDIGRGGDLGNTDHGVKASIPNANHVVFMKSDVIAQLVNHELTKTIDLKFRGTRGDNSYPLSSAYLVYGPGDSYLITTFSPSGASGNINKYLLANMINLTSGPIRMSQFAFSAPEVEEALLARAVADVKAGRKFEFKSLGEKSFAMAYWSMFLKMSGLQHPTPQEEEKGAPDKYSEISPNPWEEALGKNDYAELRKNIRVAPKQFGTFQVEYEGENVTLTAKLHHKWIQSGNASTIGTSFNFSNGALSNQEQVLIVVDPDAAKFAAGMFDWLFQNTTEKESVFEVAKARNGYAEKNKGKRSKDDCADLLDPDGVK